MSHEENTIRFFGKDGNFSIFSNYAFTPLVIGGLEYPTVEHYFQSMKFADTDPDYAEEVRLSKTPNESKQLGKSREHRIHPHWGGVDGESIRVMGKALFCKALQNERFRNLLLSTGDAMIIEASPWDSFWGEGRNKKGKNMLGKMLCDLRGMLRTYGNNIFNERSGSAHTSSRTYQPYDDERPRRRTRTTKRKN